MEEGDDGGDGEGNMERGRGERAHVDDDVLTSLRDAAAERRNRIPRAEQQISDDGRTDGQTSC